MSSDLHHLSGAYAVDALDDTERAAFEQHLATCSDCRAEVAELRAAAHALAPLTEVTPPPSLRDSVLSGISRVRPLPPLDEDAGTSAPAGPPAPVPSAPSPAPAAPDAAADVPTRAHDTPPDGGGTVVPLRRRPRTAWFAAAAAAAVIAIGGLAWSPWADDSGSLSPAAQVAAAADAMRVSSSKDGMTAELAYSRQLGRSAITVTGLAPAPAGKTYQLWYVGADRTARPAGLLTAGADGRASMVLEGDADAAAAVGMTVEPAGGSAQPTTDPIVVLSLT